MVSRPRWGRLRSPGRPGLPTTTPPRPRCRAWSTVTNHPTQPPTLRSGHWHGCRRRGRRRRFVQLPLCSSGLVPIQVGWIPVKPSAQLPHLWIVDLWLLLKPVTYEPGDGTENSPSGSPKPVRGVHPSASDAASRSFTASATACGWSSGTKWRALSRRASGASRSRARRSPYASF